MMTFNSLLHYYIREKWWRSAINLCTDELKKGKDPYVNFWRSLAFFQEGSIIDAIRDSEPLLNTRDYKFSAVNALIYYHNNYSVADNDKLTKLLEKMYDIESSCTSTDLINCCRFYLYIGDNEKFEEMIEKTRDLHFEDGEDLIVKGWKSCYSNDANIIKEGQKHFQVYVERYGPSNIDALMGGFKCLERLKENEEILEAFSEIGNLFSTFFPLHIEKCKIFLNNSDYDNALDYINSKVILKHFEVYKIMAICNLIYEGDYQKAFTNMERMWDSLVMAEPKNPELYYINAQLFSRICEKRTNFIKKCEVMIDRALEYSPRNAKYLIEKGYYRLYNGEIDNAFSIFSQAGEIDVNNKESSIGMIVCKILKGKFKEAQEDIDFLREILYQGPQIIYYEAVIKYKMGEKEEVIGGLITEALNTHVKLARMNLFNKYDNLIATDFDFLYEMAKILLLFFPFGTLISSQNVPVNIGKAQKILELIIKNKYFTNAQLLYAKLKYLLNDKNFSLGVVQNVLQIDPKNIDAFTLFALILIDLGDYSKAKEVINEAMINNLSKTREHAYFMIAKTKCEVGINDTDNAQKTLNEVLKNFEKFEQEDEICKNIVLIILVLKNSIFQLKSKDRLGLLKLNIEILLKIGKTEEAQSYINKLISEMQDSNMEDDILMFNSELALKGNDIKKAVNLLKKISTKDESNYKQSRIKLANIYLTNLMERRLYTWCYIEILENFFSFENLKLAGNALMSIDSPDEAVVYYSKALLERNDPSVMRDLGRALVKTHDYKQAITYYLDSLKKFSASLNNSNILTYYEIATDFVNIMFKLASNDLNKNSNLKFHLESFIGNLTEDLKKNDDHLLKKKLANFKFMLSNVNKNIYLENKSVNSTEIYKLLEEALKLTKEVMGKFRELKNEAALKEEKEFLSDICYEIGRYYEIIEPQLDFAEKAYLESVNNSNVNEKSLYSIANLYVKKNNFTEAHKYADMLLKLNESNEEAIKLLISIINLKKSNEFTITYLENILEKQPLSFKIIEIYIDIVKRVGKINKAKEIIQKCEKKLKYTYSPGLNFCRGVYYRYIGEINKALGEFSKSKTDEHYGAKCIEQMLEIYINPDNNILLINLDSPYEARNSTQMLNYNTNELSLNAINFLLKELKIRRNDDSTLIYEAYVAMLMKDRGVIERAIETLQDLLNRDKENLSAWVALAMANLITLKFNEVKTNLKIIEKANVSTKYYNDYERGLLIFAYLMLMTDNEKKAEELLIRTINEVNVSQIKAYDFLGMIKERHKAYNEACAYYEKAWDYSNKNSANVGYKLAACYLNNRNSVKTINICNEIKRKFPDYPIDELTNQAKNSLTG